MHQINMDRSQPLAAQPTCGHNRFHPDIAPVVEVEEGEEVGMETLDALDGQLPPTATVDDFAAINAGAVHPLTGPIYVKGAEPGDELEIEFLDIEPEPHAFSCIMPGMGFLRDIFDEPFLVHWKIRDGWATSDQIPEVRRGRHGDLGCARRSAAAHRHGGRFRRDKRGRRRARQSDRAARRQRLFIR